MNKPKTSGAPMYSLDVEADGPCAGLYSMLSFSLVPLDDPKRSFYVELAPISERFVPGALAACGFTREQSLEFMPAEAAMARFARWLENEPGSGRRVVWSDNPAFDWQFFNYYCHAYLGENPFGHSARRIADFSSGMASDVRDTSSWKKMRTEKHTHNALDDARGNAGALEKILAQAHAQLRARNQNKALAGLEVNSYRLGGDPRQHSEITLVRVPQRDGEDRWAIRDSSRGCFNKQGDWEYEPGGSSRDDAFFNRCRWNSAIEAATDYQRLTQAPQKVPRR